MTKNKRCKLLAGAVLLATSVGVVVSAILLPPAAPAIAVGGMAVAALIAGEIIKMAAVRLFSPCVSGSNPPSGNNSENTNSSDSSYHSAVSAPSRPNTPDTDRPDTRCSSHTHGSTATPVIYRYRRYRASESATGDHAVKEESYHSEELVVDGVRMIAD